jgi:hypothetical protein
MMLEVFQLRQNELIPVGELSTEATLQGLLENREYLIRADSVDSRLFVDDAPLELDARQEYWVWSPGFYAGVVVLELERPGYHEPVRYLADVGPEPGKSGREQYFKYIREIADFAPQLLLGTEPAQHALGGRSVVSISAWIRYARLRCFIESYLDALRMVCDRPVMKNRYRREQMPVHLARRVDRTTVRRLEANPKLLTAISGGLSGNAGLSLDDNRIDVPFYESTLDHPANRLLAQQLNRVLRMVSVLYDEFSRCRALAGDTETDIRVRMPRRIAYLSLIKKRLLQLSRRAPFSLVSDRKPGVAAANAVSSSPHYDRSHRLGVRLLREGLSRIVADEQHYLAPTWQIYESWCFVVLAQQLEKQLPEYEWELDTSVVSADMILNGQKGKERIRLYAQLVCPSLETPNRYGYCSTSRERRPDFVLEYTGTDRKAYICLDSKYITSRTGILDSMGSAHIYRDSIKLGGAMPICSLLLVPKNPDAALLSTEEFIRRNDAGCITMVDSDDAGAAISFLLNLFAGAIHV